MARIRFHLTYANVVSTLCLFIVLGGASYAAVELPANSVGARQIKKEAVASSAVKDFSLLATDFKAGQLPAGTPGAEGAQGATGDTGPAGAIGPRGAKGDPCPPTDLLCRGPKGDTGAAGAACLSSDPACRGPKGDKGDACLSSDPACRGPQGPPVAGLGTLTGGAASGRGTDCTIAEIILNAGVVANGVPANGQLLPINNYIALFSLIGTTYGGDGRTNFALPDLRAITPDNMTYSICVNGVYPARS